MSEIGVGVIGLGFMGKTHLGAYAKAAASGVPCRVVAVSDRDPEGALTRAAAGNLDTGSGPAVPPGARRYREAMGLLADPAVDLVSVCTPTDTHATLALAALRAGKHVVVEKPLALTTAEVRAIAEESARRPGQVCMPGMVMRFWPGWPWLKERIDEARRGGGSFGAFVGLTLQRLGAGPTWNPGFYRDPSRTGGALTDLHVHDVDFLCWCLGIPERVDSAGTLDHVTTVYRYGAAGPHHAAAQGGWGLAPGFPFAIRYTAMFDRATAVFDLAATPALTLYRDRRAEHPDVPRESAYDLEILHALGAVASAKRRETFELRATVADALAASRVLDAERASLASGRPESVAP
ncbi:MAG: Gfo/Idh/MocA family oxidoreductase [Phycisphaeraceae bacterium]|nr:MAG: Gfo/Idh/MocA family oxidoreductase [Phycisphaeraceae bacterium]